MCHSYFRTQLYESPPLRSIRRQRWHALADGCSRRSAGIEPQDWLLPAGLLPLPAGRAGHPAQPVLLIASPFAREALSSPWYLQRRIGAARANLNGPQRFSVVRQHDRSRPTGGAEPPYDSAERWLLRATDFSPEFVPLAEKPKTPRYFEMRVYHAPTQRQLSMVHERFAGSEIKIFHRVGVHPILYANTVFGNEMPNLTYIISFASLDAREKAWDAFAADPEWVKVRAESVARGGQIVNYQNIALWRAAAYSPIQ